MEWDFKKDKFATPSVNVQSEVKFQFLLEISISSKSAKTMSDIHQVTSYMQLERLSPKNQHRSLR